MVQKGYTLIWVLCQLPLKISYFILREINQILLKQFLNSKVELLYT